MASSPRARWSCSGKGKPCALCQRDIDGKCRRSDELLSCYWGQRFHPPADLKLGQILEIEGRRWAVVNLSGGFAGNSAILKPHVDRLDFKPNQLRQRQQQSAVLAPALRDLFGRVRAYVHASLAVRELEHGTAEEIRRDQQVVSDTLRHLRELREPLVLARRDDPSFSRLVAAVEHWERLVAYQAADLEVFNRCMLGTPSAEDLAALQRQEETP